MRKYIILLLVLFSSCTAELINERSEFNCGIVVGGSPDRDGFWLLVSYPDGEFWHKVTEKAYYHYDILDEICFNTIVWDIDETGIYD